MHRTLANTSKSPLVQATATAALKIPAKIANLAATPNYLGNIGLNLSLSTAVSVANAPENAQAQ